VIFVVWFGWRSVLRMLARPLVGVAVAIALLLLALFR
jgi:hypothetical protein